MRSSFSLVAAMTLSSVAFAQQPATNQDHAVHHPDAASAPVATVKKPSVKPKSQAAKPKASATAPAAMGMSEDMGRMHDQAHTAGGMHDQMHGKDGKMKGAQTSDAPAASAASK